MLLFSFSPTTWMWLSPDQRQEDKEPDQAAEEGNFEGMQFPRQLLDRRQHDRIDQASGNHEENGVERVFFAKRIGLA